MISDTILVKAKIHLIPTEKGGRKFGIRSGYRANHVFEKQDNIKNIRTCIGEISFDKNESIEPGETKITLVEFLRNEIVEKFMKIGQKWLIYEVPRLIGDGEIIEIL